DLPVEMAQLLLLCLDAVFQLEQAEAGEADQAEPEQPAEPDHAASPQAGASLRSAPRSRAERARGLAAISAAPGVASSPGQRRKLGAWAAPASGWWREVPGARPLRSRRKLLTRRSSSEWKETTASRPPGASRASADASPRSSSPSSSFTAM